MTQKELARLTNIIHQAKVMEEKAKAAKETLKQYAAENGIEQFIAGGFVVNVKTVESKVFDSARFKAEHVDMYSEYSKITSSVRINLK